MKKFLPILALAALIVSGCSNFTQEMKDGASFANLDKVYVEQPSGLGSPFAVNASKTRSRRISEIKKISNCKEPLRRPDNLPPYMESVACRTGIFQSGTDINAGVAAAAAWNAKLRCLRHA